jgi:hypothetical protein
MIEVDASDLLKWARYLDSLTVRIPVALARGLNAYGELSVRSMASQLADQYGLEAGAIMNLIVVRRATPGRLKFEADASAVTRADAQWLRPWEERDKSTFEQDTLVRIVTVGDRFDCEICAEMAENSPYTLREVNAMAQKWGHWHGGGGAASGARTNLIHPNCRCTTQPWTSTRRMKMTFGGKGAPPELLTARQLGERVADELRIELRVK